MQRRNQTRWQLMTSREGAKLAKKWTALRVFAPSRDAFLLNQHSFILHSRPAIKSVFPRYAFGIPSVCPEGYRLHTEGIPKLNRRITEA